MIVVNEFPGRLVVRAAAKVNLFLEVNSRRSDGYHDIETVFQEVAIFDDLEFQRLATGQAKSSVELYCDIRDLAPAGENLIEKAARAFFRETTIEGAVRIHLHKTIPSGAGLGGGSSNATVTLLALQRLFGLRLPLTRMLSLAASLGSDCPFFIQGGAAIGRGRGEILEPVELPRKVFLVVVPHIHCATSAIYDALARRRSALLNAPEERPRILDVKELRELDRKRFERAIFNRLEIVAFDEYPELFKLAAQLTNSCKVPFHLTGSGGGLFAICDHLKQAKLLQAACQASVAEMAAAASAECSPHPPTVRTFVAESLEQRPY